MAAAPGFTRSTIGRKVLMALTGLVLVLFVVEHALGNLLVFAGPAALNQYAAILKASPPVLWSARLFLLACVALHIWAAVSLTRQNQASRPVAYAKLEPQVATRSARLMRVGGFVILGFIIFHLLHFTVGTIHPGYAFSHTDVYGNVVSAFQVPWVVLVYLVAMVALLGHLRHGVWSFFQTMGWNHPRLDVVRTRLALGVAYAVWLGFTLIPLAIFGGFVR